MLCIYNIHTDAWFNLAAEEYLLKNFSEDIFMLWQNEPAVVIGKHQNIWAETDLEYIKEKRWIRLLFFAFCAVVFLLTAFVIAHCDSFTTGIWFPTSTNSDEVIYNRQLVGVFKVGSPLGYNHKG
uniref:lipoate--protein ligase family protein n=1 Tax=Parabacteroides gordonii TaxID=574930 RepID=UPI00350E35B9